MARATVMKARELRGVKTMNLKDFEALIGRKQWPTPLGLFREMSAEKTAGLLLEIDKTQRSNLLGAMPHQLFAAREQPS